MLFQKGERMEIKEYYAKPEQTIEEHVTKLLDELEILKKYGYIADGKKYHLVRQACLHHDDGKANPQFQLRVNSGKKIRFNPEKELPHNVLSGFLINDSEFETEEDYYRVLFAIMYHHDYGNPYEMIIGEKN